MTIDFAALMEWTTEGTVDIQKVPPDDWVMRLLGEHDLNTLDLVEASFDAIGQPYRLLVVDLTDARFIEAAILGRIVAHAGDDGELRLLVPTLGPVHRVVELLEVANRLPVFWSLHDALSPSEG